MITELVRTILEQSEVRDLLVAEKRRIELETRTPEPVWSEIWQEIHETDEDVLYCSVLLSKLPETQYISFNLAYYNWRRLPEEDPCIVAVLCRSKLKNWEESVKKENFERYDVWAARSRSEAIQQGRVRMDGFIEAWRDE